MDETTEKILSIDIGGSHIKAVVLNSNGDFLQPFQRKETPVPPTPNKVMELIGEMAKSFTGFNKITAGFPGYVKDGVIKTAPKLGDHLWSDYDMAKNLEQMLGQPARVVNDADFQALALSSGKGFELVITLGTGFGSAMMNNGVLLPHLEMSLHPITKNKTYNDYVGEDALKKIGKKKWNKRMKHVISTLKPVFNYEHLFISGGKAQLLNFKLDSNISIEGNKDGIKGGALLWKTDANTLHDNIGSNN